MDKLIVEGNVQTRLCLYLVSPYLEHPIKYRLKKPWIQRWQNNELNGRICACSMLYLSAVYITTVQSALHFSNIYPNSAFRVFDNRLL